MKIKYLIDIYNSIIKTINQLINFDLEDINHVILFYKIILILYVTKIT